jgi:hypothetical protein
MDEGLILMHLVTCDVQDEISEQISFHGLRNVPGNHLCALHCLHQSFSYKYPETSLGAVRRAGARISAAGFRLKFNRIVSSVAGKGTFRWTLRLQGEPPPPFTDLVDETARRLREEGLHEPTGHTAHITLSYFATVALPCTFALTRKIAVDVDRVALVHAGGSPYRYTVIEEWSLLPARQADLFVS